MSKANTYDERMEMVRMYNETGDTSAIADRYGLSVRTVQKRLNEMGVKLKRGAGGNKRNGTVSRTLEPSQADLPLESHAPVQSLPKQQTMHVTDDQIMILELCAKSNIDHARLAGIFAQPTFNRANIISSVSTFNDEQLGTLIREISVMAEARRKKQQLEEQHHGKH